MPKNPDCPYIPLQWRKEIRAMKCAACGSHRHIHVDHIIPMSMGGKTTRANLQPLCERCNCAKGGRVIANSALLAEIKAYDRSPR